MFTFQGLFTKGNISVGVYFTLRGGLHAAVIVRKLNCLWRMYNPNSFAHISENHHCGAEWHLVSFVIAENKCQFHGKQQKRVYQKYSLNYGIKCNGLIELSVGFKELFYHSSDIFS